MHVKGGSSQLLGEAGGKLIGEGGREQLRPRGATERASKTIPPPQELPVEGGSGSASNGTLRPPFGKLRQTQVISKKARWRYAGGGDLAIRGAGYPEKGFKNVCISVGWTHAPTPQTLLSWGGYRLSGGKPDLYPSLTLLPVCQKYIRETHLRRVYDKFWTVLFCVEPVCDISDRLEGHNLYR